MFNHIAIILQIALIDWPVSGLYEFLPNKGVDLPNFAFL